MSKNSPHIAIYLHLMFGGGVQRVMVNVMRGFVERGIKIDLVLNEVAGPYLPLVPQEVRIVDLKGAKWEVKNIPKLANYLRKEQPAALLTALHYTNEVAILAKRLARSPTPIVISERNTLSAHTRKQLGRDERWSPISARLFYPLADGIVAVSHGVAKDLSEVTGISSDRIRVIYNPTITPELFEKSKASLEHPWFESGEPPVILGIGRLVQQKDFPTLIQAFNRVRGEKLCRLVILGEGRERDRLTNLIRDLGLEKDVELPGFVSNPYAYMARSSAFVLSSLEEGLPNALIEAIALKTPVISTNCQSGPDEILNNGQYGWLVPVGDDKAMAEAILTVLSGQTKFADSTWLNQFTIETAIQKYLDVMKYSLP